MGLKDAVLRNPPVNIYQLLMYIYHLGPLRTCINITTKHTHTKRLRNIRCRFGYYVMTATTQPKYTFTFLGKNAVTADHIILVQLRHRFFLSEKINIKSNGVLGLSFIMLLCFLQKMGVRGMMPLCLSLSFDTSFILSQFSLSKNT